MKSKLFFPVILLAILCICSIAFAQEPPTHEKITLTTYYPAPYGEYNSLSVGDPTAGYTATNPGELLVQGNLGIGTTNPSGILHVNGGTAASGSGRDITLQAENAASWSNADGGNIILLPGIGDGTGVDGNVGIGTTDPKSLLHINSTTGNSLTLASFINTLDANLEYNVISVGKTVNSNDNSAFFGYLNTNNADPTKSCAFMSIYGDSPNTGQGLFYQHGGNVGIGTTGPEAKLDIKLGSDIDYLRIQRNSATGRSQLVLADENAVCQWRFGMTAPGDTKLKFWDEDQDVLTMERNGNVYFQPKGNVGIGTTNPQAKLHVAGTAGTDGIMFPDGTLQTTAQPPKARVYINYRQQNLPQNIWTVVRLNEIDYDPNSMVNVSTNRIIISEAGYYAIAAQAMFISVSSGRLYYAAIRKNGDTFVTICGAHSATTYNLPVLIADTVYLAAGDYLELVVKPCDAGSSTDLGGGPEEGKTHTHLAIHKIP